MADHEEYRIRKKELETNPYFKNFKEGYYQSPNGTKVVKVVASYEAKMINISWNNESHTSIYPTVWFHLFDDWKFIGGNHERN